jgi:hypothetical protein
MMRASLRAAITTANGTEATTQGPAAEMPAEGVKSDTHRARVQPQARVAVEPGATALDDTQERYAARRSPGAA